MANLVGHVTADQAALAALRQLVAHGFHGRKLFSEGRVSLLVYRREFRGVVDVVQVFGPDEAEAYRAADRIELDAPVDLVDVEDRAVWTLDGSVADVVASILELPWGPSHFPAAAPASASSSTSARPSST